MNLRASCLWAKQWIGGARLRAALAGLAIITASPINLVRAAATPEIESPERFKNVAEWTVSFTTRTVLRGQIKDGEGLVINNLRLQMDQQSADGTAALATKGVGEIAASVPPAILEMMKQSNPKAAAAFSEEEWAWEGPASGELRRLYKSESTGISSGNYRLREEGQGKTDVWLRLRINFKKQTYSIECDGSTAKHVYDRAKGLFVQGTPIEITNTQTSDGNAPIVNKSKQTLGFARMNEALPLSGMDLTGVERKKLSEPSAGAEGFTEIRWNITKKTLRPQVYLETDDDTFLPEPGATTTVSLRWDRGTPDRVEYRLSEVSTEPGTCLNSPARDRDPDVTFAPGQAGLVIQGNVATAETPVRRVTLATHDYAAYTHIQARALFGNDWVEAKATVGGGKFVTVPRDEDDNHIADIWQAANGTEGKKADWDEDAEPKTARKKGDGLRLFEEYRGVMTKSGYTRLDPNRMELFILDPDKLVDLALWRKITGSIALPLENSQHDQQRVDFNSHYADGSPKYAVKMLKMMGTVDPLGLSTFTGIWGDTDGAVADGPVTSRVFVERPGFGMTNVLRTRIQAALANAASPDGVMLYGQGFTATMLSRGDSALGNPTVVTRMTEKHVRYTAIHELGHACDLGHHAPKDTLGTTNCVMRNFTDKEKHFDTVQELLRPTSGLLPFGITQFCVGGADDCAGRFRLKK